MKKSESLIATLLAIYGILCAISIALYALIQLIVDDKPTATNLLIWSATMFAPIAVLMTYTSWREQHSSQEIAEESKSILIQLIQVQANYNELKNMILANNLEISLFKEKLYSFNEQRLNLKKQCWVLEELINDEDDKVKLRKFNENLLQFKDNYFQFINNRQSLSENIGDRETFIKFKELLVEYILYKK